MKKNKSLRLSLMVAGLLLLTVVITISVLILPRARGAEAVMPSGGRGGEEERADEASVGKQGCLTILLAGTDRASGLSDVLMLIRLDRDTGEARILQLPRDTYANCGTGRYRKLNGVPSALGAMEKFREFLTDALGISIDRYVRLSPDAFRRAVDAMGGVEIELEEALHYEDPAQGLSIHLPAGKQRLDGVSAEQFVRFRSDYVRGDLGRMDAQKIFLAALLGQIRANLSPLTLAKLGMSLLGEVETDLSLADLTMLSEEIIELRADRVYFLTAPGADTTSASGGSFYVLSAPAMDEVLRDLFGGAEGGFDPNEAFLYRKSPDFVSIYESYSHYEVFTATGIRENGLGIQRKE